jgi:hypothetical protein
MAESIQFIKITEMAHLLSRSVKQFRTDVATQAIPHIKLGRTKLFNPEQVIKYLSVQLNNQANESSEPTPEKTQSKTINFSLKNTPSQNLKADEIKRYKEMVGLE